MATVKLAEQDQAHNLKLSFELNCNSKELTRFYDNWAPKYDQVLNDHGYVAPQNGAKKLVHFLEQHKFATDCKILDVCSGTGLVGQALKQMNYLNVDALEPSEKSSDLARSKGLYKNFFTELFIPGKQLPIPSNTYDAAICIGGFTKGHVKAEMGAMDEMARVVKPGGLICFTIRDDVMFDKEYGYEEKMAQFLEEKAWKLLFKSVEPYRDSFDCHMFVYQVL